MTQVTASLSEEDFGAILALMRQRDYVIKRQLGKGGCGRTLLLLDTSIGEELVCKEYAPANERRRQDLFDSFVREIKLMLRVNHENVVRIYHHYIYPDLLQGFILMEHVNGFVIDRYLESKPERINHVFVQAVAGFAHLQRVGILHRDIRIANLMVRHDDTVKIIDLGFGKQVRDSDDFDNSTKITRWCPDPYDFSSARYDFCTEVYFVGSLFRKLIFDLDIKF